MVGCTLAGEEGAACRGALLQENLAANVPRNARLHTYASAWSARNAHGYTGRIPLIAMPACPRSL